MHSNLKRKIERLEQAIGISEGTDPRAYSYPNNLVEAVLMARMTEDQLKEHLMTRCKKPSPELCDRFDELFERVRKNNSICPKIRQNPTKPNEMIKKRSSQTGSLKQYR